VYSCYTSKYTDLRVIFIKGPALRGILVNSGRAKAYILVVIVVQLQTFPSLSFRVPGYGNAYALDFLYNSEIEPGRF